MISHQRTRYDILLLFSQKIIDLVAVDAEGAEFGMLEDLIESGVWKQIKQLTIEFHFFREQRNFFLRHAQAVDTFLHESSFVQVNCDLLENPAWMIDIGHNFKMKTVAVLIVHYINKEFLPYHGSQMT